MEFTSHAIAVLPEGLRLMGCLLHSVPGAVGRLATHDGGEHLVAHHRVDATLTPCQLRTGLLQPMVPGVPHLSRVIRSIELTGSLVEIGGGLCQRSHPSAPDERWFGTVLGPERVAELAAACPSEVDHVDIRVRIHADLELGASAVCISGDTGASLRLDAVACWLHSRCLIEELIAHVAGAAGAAGTAGTTGSA